MTELDKAQVECLAKVGFHPGGAVFMEQGLGKTLTVWEEFDQCVKHYDATFMLVIAPNTFKTGWRDEMEKHGFDYPIVVYESKKHRIQYNQTMSHDKVVLVVNYESMRGDKLKDFIYELCEKHDSKYIVADESINLGNYKSQQTKSCINVAKEFQWRRILSGKPVTQGPHNLWGQLRFIGALSGVNYFVFRNRFCVMGGYKNKQVINVKNEDKLRKLLDEWAFIARKKNYLDIKDKRYAIRHVPLHPKVQKLYEEMENEMLVELENGSIASAELVLTRLLRQSQIASGFVTDEDGEVNWLVEDKDNTRLQSIGQLYGEMDSKLVICVAFKPTIQKIRELYDHLSPAFIVGGMTTEEVDEEKRRFNRDPDCRVIVLSKAAKYGHTLLARGQCYSMFFYENTYSLDDRSQLEDRIHRRGQSEWPLYTDLYSTPENKKNVKSLIRKENVAARLLGYEPTMFDV